MSRRLVVEATGFGVRGALLEDHELVEVIDADEHGAAVTDALFAARVTSIDQRLNAAFLDIGTGIPAFLNAKDARHARAVAEKLPVSRLVQEGASLIVQGVREGEGGKGPRVTTDLKLFGFHLLWRPHGTGGIPLETVRGAERQALQTRGHALFPERGVTLRKLARDVPDEALQAELGALEARWARIQAEAKAGRPGRLGADEPPLERLLRAVLSPELAAIEAADAEILARLRRLLEGPLSAHAIELVRLAPERLAFEQTEVAGALEAALEREVALPGGGRLIVEPTAAFVAIDVDGGGQAALDVDLEAARAVARLVRLRNLGGTIVVDFVDLATKAQRQRLEDGLKRAFREDPATVDIHPMSALGIVQISRSRRGRSLDSLLRRPCPCCAGGGVVPSLRARAEELIGAIRGGNAIRRVRVAPDLEQYLRGAAAAAWQAAASGIELEGDPGLETGAFQVE
jgi:Rne/Rng family ribonuclease